MKIRWFRKNIINYRKLGNQQTESERGDKGDWEGSFHTSSVQPPEYEGLRYRHTAAIKLASLNLKRREYYCPALCCRHVHDVFLKCKIIELSQNFTRQKNSLRAACTEKRVMSITFAPCRILLVKEK